MMLAGILLVTLGLANAAPDVVFLGRVESRASTRSNSVDVLTPAIDLSLEPAVQIGFNTRLIQSQLVLTPSISARISVDSENPVQPLFSQRIDAGFATGEEYRSLFLVGDLSLAAGLLDVNTAAERLGQPFGLNAAAGVVPLVDAGAGLQVSTRPYENIRLRAWGRAGFLAVPAPDALNGGVTIGDDVVGAFTSLEPQLRPEVGFESTYFFSELTNVEGRVIIDSALEPDVWRYSGVRALALTSFYPSRNLTTTLQVGTLVAALDPSFQLSVWPILAGDITLATGAPETLLPGGGSLGGGRGAFSISTGLEPEYDPFLVQVNWQGRFDMTAAYLPSPRLEWAISAGLYARFLSTLPAKPTSTWVSEVGFPDDNGANQIAVLTGRMRYDLNRQLVMETGIVGTARISATGQTAPQISVFVAFSGRARDDDVVDLAGDIWRSFY